MSLVHSAGSSARIAAGKRLVAAGKVGCLLLAGGQGTRLGHAGPKGTYPLFPGVSLFGLLASRIRSASQKAGRPLPVAIMVSPGNEQATRAFFAKHDHFGLTSLSFLLQEELPALGSQALFPAGNGWALKHLVEQGVAKQWEVGGVKWVNTIPIDNPLADPFDPELLAFEEADVVIKCIRRSDPKEKVGILMQKEGTWQVVEYSEIEDLRLHYPLASIGLFCFSMPFVHRAATYSEKLPIHIAQKRIPKTGQVVDKQERFLFDLLPFSKRTEVIEYERHVCFAPLKNAQGPDSPAKVRASLLQAESAFAL